MDSFNQDMVLGELRGQVRELVHAMNNLSGKFDGLTREVVKHSVLAEEVGELKVSVAAILAQQNKDAGAKGMLHSVITSPALGWLFTIAVMLYGFLSGSVHIGD